MTQRDIACSACRTETSTYFIHELLSVPVCEECHNHYHCGDFPIDDSSGNEIYCRWCGQGEGELVLCDTCPKSFCERCLGNNFGSAEVQRVRRIQNLWSCILCSPQPLKDLIQKNHWNLIEPRAAQPKTAIRPAKKLKSKSNKSASSDGRIICYDISNGRETFEIPVVNDYDDAPAPTDFVYITQPVVSEGTTLTNNPNFLICCSCEDNCRDPAKCECIIASSGKAYSIEGRLITGKVDGIYECNYKCKCHRLKCKNRVVSNGPKLKLELFRCENPDKGWGVRCKTEIPAGTFIADYAGEIIPEAMVESRGLEKCDQYLFNTDSWARTRACHMIASLGLKTPLPKIPREYIVDAGAMDEKSLQQYFDDDLIQILSKHGAIRRAQEKFNRKRKLHSKEGPDPNLSWYEEYCANRKQEWQEATIAIGDRVISETEERGESFTIDARWYGSIGRFLNHSCQPNLDIIPVFCETQNAMYPRIAFFSMDRIPPNTELCYDYGYQQGNVDGKHRTCLCGADYCRQNLY